MRHPVPETQSERRGTDFRKASQPVSARISPLDVLSSWLRENVCEVFTLDVHKKRRIIILVIDCVFSCAV
jgi:hypothetical protein